LAAGQIAPDTLAIEGDAGAVQRWLDLHDTFDLWFNIATP